MKKPCNDEIIDFLIKDLSIDKSKLINTKLISQKFNLSYSNDDVNLITNALKDAERKNLIEINGNSSNYATLTENGDIIKSIGWLKHLENKKKEDDKLKENKNLENEKSIIDLKLKKLQHSTFWWIFGFAIIGVFLSVYNFIKNIPLKNEKQKEEKIKKVESKISKSQILILEKKEIDSLRKLKPDSTKL